MKVDYIAEASPLNPFPMNLSAKSIPSLRRSALRRCLSGHGGFTLVEVTMAIGIISFAFVATIGLLPVGLSVSRQAIETTIQSQIVQQLTTQALQTDFSQLENLGNPQKTEPYYFDDQGKATGEAGSLYKATFQPVPLTTDLPAGVSTRKLKTVTISIENTRGSAAQAAANAKKFTILIPDNGL